jgi:hypothetical protein
MDDDEVPLPACLHAASHARRASAMLTERDLLAPAAPWENQTRLLAYFQAEHTPAATK